MILLMLSMTLMGSRAMQNYNNPNHGNMHKNKRIQFTIRILHMENNFKNLLQFMIRMILRSMRWSQIIRGIYLQTSGERASCNKIFKKIPKLKSQANFVATCCRNILPWKLFKKGRQLQIFLISFMIQQLTKWYLSLACNNIYLFQGMWKTFHMELLSGECTCYPLIFKNISPLEGSWRILEQFIINYQDGGTYQTFCPKIFPGPLTFMVI